MTSTNASPGTLAHSSCSVAFGKGITSGQPGSVQRLLLAVYDIDAARDDLLGRGIRQPRPPTATCTTSST